MKHFPFNQIITKSVFAHVRSMSDGRINLVGTVATIDLHKAKKILAKQVVSRAINMRDGAREKLQKRGLLKSNTTFGSNIPSIVKV